MKPSFLLFANKDGIACGSSANMTIFQLSKIEPVAMAVSPDSPIPWRDIIEGYRRLGEPSHYSDFTMYAKDFEAYLETIDNKPAWCKLSEEATQITFMGFGSKDIYPSICDIEIALDEEAKRIKFKTMSTHQISHSQIVYWTSIGRFDRIEMLFRGATTQMNLFMLDKVQNIYEKYAAKVKTHFAGSEYENMVEKYISKFNVEEQAKRTMQNATKYTRSRLQLGLNAFSIEELVSGVETIINANMRLSHLQAGCKEPLGETCEIAVLTRGEGFNWIKHSLFAR